MIREQRPFQKLYDAAMKATPGEWVAENGAVFSASEGTANYMLAEICGGTELSAEQDWRNAEFIAAANPPIVLALLGALEAAEKQITELTLACALNETTISMQKDLSTESERTGPEERSLINWNEMSKRGLVFRINHEILHPLGLTLSYNPDTGVSECAYVSPDGGFQYSDELKEVARANGWIK